jgi:hypothetical protein
MVYASINFENWALYDLSGRLITSGNGQNGNTVRLPATLSTGMYLFSAAAQGQVFSEYITIE